MHLCTVAGVHLSVLRGVWCLCSARDAAAAAAATAAAEQASKPPLLGAGYDTRCYRFAQAMDAKAIRRFEVDLPALQSRKASGTGETRRRPTADLPRRTAASDVRSS
jgi:O-methyltransferase involved in polyketide biosynthesis